MRAARARPWWEFMPDTTSWTTSTSYVLLRRGRPDLALQTGLRGREVESEEAPQVHSARLSTLFPADIAVFTGSAAQPRTPVCKTFGCFNDASTWTPSGLAGAEGLRSHSKRAICF